MFKILQFADAPLLMTISVYYWNSIAKNASLRFAAFSMTGAIGGVRGSEEAHFEERLLLDLVRIKMRLFTPLVTTTYVVILKEKTEACGGFRLKNLLLQPDNIPLSFPSGVQKKFE